MKTIEFFNDKIIDSATELLGKDGKLPTKIEVGVLKARIQFFKDCRNYMLSQPKEEFVRAEILRIETFINAKLLEFSEGVDTSKLTVKATSDLRKKHEDKYGIAQKRKQLKALRFLLD